MATSVTKAVLLNIGAFLADNNIRRNIGTYSYNYTSPTSNVITNSLTLNVGDTFVWNTPLTVSNLTFLSSNGPLRVAFILPVASPVPSYTVDLKRAHLVDSDVRQLTIQNLGPTVVNFTLIQS